MAPLKLHLKTGGTSQPSQPPTPSAQTPGGGLKLKLGSQPATPSASAPSSDMMPPPTDSIKRRNKPSAKKRAADQDDDEDTITPVAKRPAPESRKSSLVLKNSKKAAPATPASAGPRISLKQKRQPSAPILRRLNVKGRVPDRIPGNAYDSEDSDREKDPATEQQLILRMEPGEDADYLRDAITNKTIGLPLKEGGADVTIRFVERELRRAVVTVKGRMYAAALVDLPCIVETMKSWDKKGWWKVADIHQMLLVIGRCSNDEEAKNMPLPRGGAVNPSNMQYAHGLTPPMHWVRKRRFRKRLSYKDTANIEEEVQKLLEDDERAERDGGETTFEILNRESLERSMEPDNYFDDDAEGEAVSTIEDGYDEEQLEEMDEAAAEAQLQGLFDLDNEAAEPQMIAAEDTTASPANLADSSASFAQVQAGLDSVAATPAAAETPAQSSDEDESDEDEDDDDIDVVDEDAAMKAAERNQQMEEIHDLEREVEIQRQKLAGQKNQLLREKTMKQLRSLEEDLRIKKGGLGMGMEEDDEE